MSKLFQRADESTHVAPSQCAQNRNVNITSNRTHYEETQELQHSTIAQWNSKVTDQYSDLQHNYLKMLSGGTEGVFCFFIDSFLLSSQDSHLLQLWVSSCDILRKTEMQNLNLFESFIWFGVEIRIQMSTSLQVTSQITVLVDVTIVKMEGSFYGPILCKVDKALNQPMSTGIRVLMPCEARRDEDLRM